MSKDRAPDPYLDTVARMEPDIAFVDMPTAAASIAISLRRIADSLDRLSSSIGLAQLLRELVPIVEDLKDDSERGRT